MCIPEKDLTVLESPPGPAHVADSTPTFGRSSDESREQRADSTVYTYYALGLSAGDFGSFSSRRLRGIQLHDAAIPRRVSLQSLPLSAYQSKISQNGWCAPTQSQPSQMVEGCEGFRWTGIPTMQFQAPDFSAIRRRALEIEHGQWAFPAG